MTVTITSEVLGKSVGQTYTGPLEAWLLQEGYARNHASSLTAAITVTPVAATLVGSANAVNLTASGTVVFATKDGVSTSVSLASGDTPAQAATKIDTALSALADASIVSNKLNVVSNATGRTAYVRVVSGTSAILANLGLAVGQTAFGASGRAAGASNVGATAVLPAADPQVAANREKVPVPNAATNVSIANDGAHLTLTKNPVTGSTAPDYDPAGADDDAPVGVTLSPATAVHGVATVVALKAPNNNMQGVTSVTFGGVAGTALDLSHAADGKVLVTTPTGVAAGTVDVVLVDPAGNLTLTGAFVFS